MRSILAPLAAIAALTSTVSAHGHVTGVVAGGKWYHGYDPEMQYQNPPPSVAGWTANNLDNGFVAPDAFATEDIICHKAGKAGTAYVPVAAGQTVTLQWNTWPTSHKGPVLDYIAPCNGNCSNIAKGSLSFVKIDQGGLKSGYNPGTWVTDDLIANNNSWTVTIPSTLKAGNYVLRHEIIALHAAGSTNGAQAYPQCINLQVTGSGTVTPTGISATKFYTPTDPGILFDLYRQFTNYTIPGPALWTGKRRREHARDFS